MGFHNTGEKLVESSGTSGYTYKRLQVTARKMELFTPGGCNSLENAVSRQGWRMKVSLCGPPHERNNL